MANSSLQGKTYTLPDNVLDFLRNRKGTGDFEKRVNGLLNTGSITYEQLKFFKHDLETQKSEEWQPFLNWINTVLNMDRKNVEVGKEVTDSAGMANRYRSERGVDLNRSTKDALLSETISKVLKEELNKLK